MIKKIFLFLILGMSLIGGLNAVTNLNSCGTVALASNTIYNITFDEIPSSYTGTNCFYIYTTADNNYQNITFTSNGNNILNSDSSLVNFISIYGVGGFNNFTIRDIKLTNYNDINFIRVEPRYSVIVDVKDWSIYNIYINYLNNFIQLQTDDAAVYTREVKMFYTDIYNVYIDDIKDSVINVESGGSTEISYFAYSDFYDSYLMSTYDNFNFFDMRATSTAKAYYNNFDNIVVGGGDFCDLGLTFCTLVGTTITNSLLKYYNSTDSNDDNIADSDPYLYMTDLNIYVDLDNKRFFQDYTEGEPFMNIQTMTALIPIRDGKTGSPVTISLQSPLDSSYISTNLTNLNAFISSDDIDCSIMTSDKCYMFNDPYTTSSTGNLFGSYIAVQTDSRVNNVNFSVSHDSSSGSVESSVIGNYIDQTYNNIEISNNDLKSTGNIYVSPDVVTARPFIKLKANNIDINNNDFLYDFSINSGIGDFLWISSISQTSNNIYLNRFENDVITPLQKSKVFGWEGSSYFYNNYIGNNVVITDNYLPSLSVNKLVGYQHTDNKIYYFNIGNYYEENTGCVDSTSDGICDSSYTSGAITDDYPLSSYPFDYTSHLLTAVSVVDINDFNITLTSPTPNETITLSALTDIVTLGFSHDSDFTDLVCSYIVDGLNIQDMSPPNTPKDTTISIQVTDWTEKTYTYRVECSNDFIYSYSNEILFTITLSSAGGDTGGDISNDTLIPDLGDIDFGIGSIITGSTEDSVDGLFSLFGLLDQPVGYAMLIGFMFIFVALTMLVMALLLGGLKIIMRF